MYESYWHLQKKPFGNGFDPKLYYPTEAHQAALAKLRYTLENDRGAAVLVGGSGTGKTLLLKLLLAQLPDECAPRAHLVFPQMAAADLLAYMARELGAGQPAAPSASPLADCVAGLQRRLQENAAQGRRAIVVVDEAHLLEGPRAFETLRLLMNFETDAGPAMSLVLAGQPSLLAAIDRWPHLEERVGAKCHLGPLSLEETMAYVQHRLLACGGSAVAFDAAALERVHELGRGTPRRINRLCDLAMLIGFAEELPQIGIDQIEAVAEDLHPAPLDR